MDDKTWHDANGNLRHFVSKMYCADTGANIVVSRSWRARHQQWDYHAETNEIVEFQKKLKAIREQGEAQ